jgi:hypothetical protein
MGIKDKCKAAAHATAARLLVMKAQVKNPALNDSDVEILENNAEGSACESGIMLEDSDCEYEGGVNCYWSDSRNHLSKKSLKPQDICAFFCLNFIAS